MRMRIMMVMTMKCINHCSGYPKTKSQYNALSPLEKLTVQAMVAEETTACRVRIIWISPR